MTFSDLFRGLFDTDLTQLISPGHFLLCLFVSLFLGLILALTCMYRAHHTKSFLLTIALLPTVVCVVIMMVNGNVGAGVAVAGAFSLVRFRSAPGTAKEICALFLAMGTGLIAGMGYLGFSALFTLFMCLCFFVLNRLDLGEKKQNARCKTLGITIPEDLDYTGVFDDIFSEYTAEAQLVRVKTTDLGSLLRLTYHIVLKDPKREKEMLDALRCRNGNLEICLSRREMQAMEL